METGRRYSKKREAIREMLLRSDEHPSAENIFQTLKPRYPDLSLGTVYRNLALFREEGEVMSVATVNGEERFDAHMQPHAHFVCIYCGKVSDLSAPPPSLTPPFPLPGKALSCSVTYYGECSECQQKDQK